jgi:hypothetical protein
MSQENVDVVAFGCDERWEDTRELFSGRPLIRGAVGYTIQNKLTRFPGFTADAGFLAAGGFDLDTDMLYNQDEACQMEPGEMSRGPYHVMCKALVGSGGDQHKEAIANQLWHVVAGAASQLDWQTADKAAALAMQIAGPSAIHSRWVFRALCRFSPRLAIRMREALIRAFKPRLRAGYPAWLAPVSLF